MSPIFNTVALLNRNLKCSNEEKRPLSVSHEMNVHLNNLFSRRRFSKHFRSQILSRLLLSRVTFRQLTRITSESYLLEMLVKRMMNILLLSLMMTAIIMMTMMFMMKIIMMMRMMIMMKRVRTLVGAENGDDILLLSS